jgi:hypothetical protein
LKQPAPVCLFVLRCRTIRPTGRAIAYENEHCRGSLPFVAGQSRMKRGSTRSPDEPLAARTRGRWRHPGAVPHVAELVIGRAFARPVGSCGLLAGKSVPTFREVDGFREELNPSYALPAKEGACDFQNEQRPPTEQHYRKNE